MARKTKTKSKGEKIETTSPPKKVETYRESTNLQLSRGMYDLDNVRWKMPVLSTRLLFAIAQSLDSLQEDVFPEFQFEINAVFKYLGLENNNDRHNRLNDALMDIMRNPLSVVSYKTSGARQWFGLSWISWFKYSDDDNYIYLQVTEDARQYLRDIVQYSPISPKYYLKLSTEYQNWFYPFLKNYRKDSRGLIIEIAKLKTALSLEKQKSYNPTKTRNANESFFKRVIGIELSEKAKAENAKASKEKRKAKFVPWDFVRDSSGEFTGTLHTINEHTDITVLACALKTGITYTHLWFKVKEKVRPKAKVWPSQKDSVEGDMGRQQDLRGRKRSAASMGNLFQDIYVGSTSGSPRIKKYTHEELSEACKELGISPEEFIKSKKMKTDDEGNYYYEY